MSGSKTRRSILDEIEGRHLLVNQQLREVWPLLLPPDSSFGTPTQERRSEQSLLLGYQRDRLQRHAQMPASGRAVRDYQKLWLYFIH